MRSCLLGPRVDAAAQTEAFRDDAPPSSSTPDAAAATFSLQPPLGRSLPRALILCHQSLSPRCGPSSGWAQRGGVLHVLTHGGGRSGAWGRPRGSFPGKSPSHPLHNQPSRPGREQELKVLEGAVGAGEGLERGLCELLCLPSPGKGGLQETLGTRGQGHIVTLLRSSATCSSSLGLCGLCSPAVSSF